MLIKAVLLDLDNCLSEAGEVGRGIFEPALVAIRQANQGTLSPEALEAALADTWYHSLDFVARRHGFSKEMLTAGWKVFSTLEISTPMMGYPDLAVLAELPVLRFLVTTGFRRLQESKIRALGFAHLFTGIEINAIDEADAKGKKHLFQQILLKHHLAPEEVLVLGDNPDSEIEAGNQLGIQTVQILRAGVVASPQATFQVKTLMEFKKLVLEGPNGAGWR